MFYKSLLLLVLSVHFFLISPAQDCKHCKIHCNNYKRDSVIIKVSDSLVRMPIVIDTSSLSFLVKKSNEEAKDKEKNPAQWMSLLFTLVGLPFIYFTFIRTARFKNFDFLSDVDKQLMQNPQLWGIYDKKVKENFAEVAGINSGFPVLMKGRHEIFFDDPITLYGVSLDSNISSGNVFSENGVQMNKLLIRPGQSVVIIGSIPGQSLFLEGEIKITASKKVEFKNPRDKDTDNRIEAFCYYKLNNFENVFQNFGWIKLGSVFNAWERYLLEIMMTSSPFNEIVEKSLKRNYLGGKFTRRMEKYKSISVILRPYHDDFEQGLISKADYNKKYHGEINKKFIFQKLQSYIMLLIIASILTICIWFCFFSRHHF